MIIQPLDEKKVNKYFQKVGSRFITPYTNLVKQTIEIGGTDEEKEFLCTPLFLSIFVLAYQNATNEELTALATSSNYRKKLFDDYIEYMFKRRKNGRLYTIEQLNRIKRGLVFVARSMIERRQSLFYLEDIGSNWLPFSQLKHREQIDFFLLLNFSLIFGVMGMLISRLISEQGIGLLFGLIMGLFFGVMFVSFYKKKVKDVKPSERLIWVWKDGLFGSILGLMIGFLFGIIVLGGFGLMVFRLVLRERGYTVSSDIRLSDQMLGGVIGGLIFGLIFCIIGGLKPSAVEHRNKPGEGIKASVKNAFIVALLRGMSIGLVSGFTGGVFGGLISMLSSNSNDMATILRGVIIGGFSVGLFFGLGAALIGWLNYGGDFYLLHIISRYLLYRSGHIPWDIISFLDFCTNCIFLRRVGGGYIFIHRMLMEHFAAMAEEPENN